MLRIDEVLRRLQAIDKNERVLDKPKAEDALSRHFAAAGLARPPVFWAKDADEGRERMFGARPVVGVNAKAWRHVELVALQGVGRLVIDALWTDAAEATHLTSRDSARDLLRDAAWSALESRALFMSNLRGRGLPLGDRGMHPRSAALAASLAAAWRPQMRRHISIWEPFLDASEAGLWVFWVVEHEIVAVPRPILRGIQGRLHHDTLPAVEWPSSQPWWVWRGVRVPREVIEDPGAITLATIAAERNVELRRILIERYGHARYLSDLGARPVSTDDFGTLYWVEMPGDEPLALVKVVNSTPEPDGTRKDYFLRVPPRIKTAQAAVAWTFGLAPGAYRPEKET
jgi:hypothetical protein